MKLQTDVTCFYGINVITRAGFFNQQSDNIDNNADGKW